MNMRKCPFDHNLLNDCNYCDANRESLGGVALIKTKSLVPWHLLLRGLKCWIFWVGLTTGRQIFRSSRAWGCGFEPLGYKFFSVSVINVFWTDFLRRCIITDVHSEKYMPSCVSKSETGKLSSDWIKTNRIKLSKWGKLFQRNDIYKFLASSNTW